jgi:hypothetical protein
METTNIYDFLHLLSLIKTRPIMDFGVDLAFSHLFHNKFLFFLFFIKENGEARTKTKLRGKRHNMASIDLFISFSFFKLMFN